MSRHKEGGFFLASVFRIRSFRILYSKWGCLVLTGRCSRFVSMPEQGWLLRKK